MQQKYLVYINILGKKMHLHYDRISSNEKLRLINFLSIYIRIIYVHTHTPSHKDSITLSVQILRNDRR